MKPKIILCLAAVVLLNSACRVLRSMVILSVDSTNIQTMPFVVKTEVTDYGRKILFSVIADPKGAPYAPEDNMHFSLGGASLSVYDGTNCISSCSVAGQKVPSNMPDVKLPLADKSVLFEFTVGTSYLRSVEFEIGYGSALHPTIDNYRFALQTFVPSADIGLLPGVKDQKPDPSPYNSDALEILRKGLQNGTPEQKEHALEAIMELGAIRLLPDVMEAIEDPTPLPRHGDTGWGFVGHEAATVMGKIAQTLDGVDLKDRGYRAYSFWDDSGDGGAKLKAAGRLAEVRRNWEKWWQDRSKIK